jgi:hypothetical protein
LRVRLDDGGHCRVEEDWGFSVQSPVCGAQITAVKNLRFIKRRKEGDDRITGLYVPDSIPILLGDFTDMI